VEYDRYVLSPNPSAFDSPPRPQGRAQAEYPRRDPLTRLARRGSADHPTKMSKDVDNYTAYLDFAKTGRGLLVRSLKAGDRFQPLGMNQPKKLGEFMLDAKIPRAWRQRVPIVCSPQQILWAVGWRIDERMKVTASTRKVLRLRFEQNVH